MKSKYLQLFVISLFIAFTALSCKHNTTDPAIENNWDARLDFVNGDDSGYLKDPMDAVDSIPKSTTTKVVVNFGNSYTPNGVLSVKISRDNDNVLVYVSQASVDSANKNNTSKIEFQSIHIPVPGAYTASLMLNDGKTLTTLHTRKIVVY